MRIGCLVAFSTFCCAIRFCCDHQGTWLASKVAREAPNFQDPTQQGPGASCGEASKEINKSCTLELTEPSLLALSVLAPNLESNIYDDLVLQNMSSEQSTSGHELPHLSATLVGGMETEGKVKKPKSQCTETIQDEVRHSSSFQTGGRDCDLGSGPMDRLNTPVEIADTKEDRTICIGDGCQRRAGGRSPCDRGAASSGSVARGAEGVGPLQGLGEFRHRAVRFPLGTVRISEQEGTGSQCGQSSDTWTSEQDRKIEEASHFCREEDQESGCRVDEIHEEDPGQSDASCPALSELQGGAPCRLQPEDGGLAQSQTGSERGLHVAPQSERTRGGIERDARCSPAVGSFDQARDYGNCTMHQFGRGGGGNGCCRTERGQESRGQEIVPGVSVPESSCTHSLEAQSREQVNQSSMFDLSFARFGHEYDECFEFPWTWNRHVIPSDSQRNQVVTCLMYEPCQDDWVFPHASESAAKKRVTFSEKVEVRIEMDSQIHEVLIPSPSLHLWARTMWHMHGQMDHLGIRHALNNASSFPQGKVTEASSETQEHNTGEVAVDTTQNDVCQDQRISDSFQVLEGLLDKCRTEVNCRGKDNSAPRISVETWYLCKDMFEVCTRSRRVWLRGDMNVDDVQRELENTWRDVLQEGPVECLLVEKSSSNSGQRGFHVILVQRADERCKAILTHSIAFPPLQQHRAVLARTFESVISFFVRAQIRTVIAARNTRFCVEWNQQQVTYRECDSDLFTAPDGSLVQAHMMELEETSDEEEETTERSEADESTRWNGSDLSDLDDSVSLMSAGLPLTTINVPDFQGYPWENHNQGEPGLDEDEEVDIEFAPGHEFQATHHLYHRVGAEEDDIMWNVVTFGLGLGDLGRRDTRLSAGMEDELLDKVFQLWHDHAQHGDLEVLYVTPQPLMDVSPCIVLVVVVRYAIPSPQDRKVLVTEWAPQGIPARTRPYAAWIYVETSAAGIAAALGHHCCYPLGIHDCHVTQKGQPMLPGQMYDIQDGALVTFRIDQYPQHVAEAAREIERAEDFYLVARSVFEHRGQHEGTIILRVHGISASNHPMGHRDQIVDFKDLKQGRWIKELQSLRPFAQPGNPCIAYVPELAVEHDNVEAPVFHFVMDANGGYAKIPIVIRQRMNTVHGNHQHEEIWAVGVGMWQQGENLARELSHPPFWVDPTFHFQMHRYGVSTEEVDKEWRPGDCLHIEVQVQDHFEMLHRLLTYGHADGEKWEDEDTAALLQMQASFHQTDTQEPHVAPLVFPKHQASTIEEVSDELQTILADLQHHDWKGLNWDFDALPLTHPAACHARNVTKDCTQTPTCFHIYTDGSCKHNVAAWAFVVVVEWYDGKMTQRARVGYAGQTLNTDIGPFECTAADAEATALIAAAEYLLSRPNKDKLEIHLHYDATAVGHAAVGAQNLPVFKKGSSFRQKAARILVSLLQRASHHLKGWHVKAHDGHPWNEMADNAAMLFREGWTGINIPQLKSKALLSHPYCQWAWLELAPDQFLPDLATILRNLPPMPDAGLGDTVFQHLEAKEREHVECKHHTFRVATANVGTMHYNDESHQLAMSHKVAEIVQQMTEKGFHIAIQESRARYTQTVQTGPYVRLISQASRGQGGVELWLHTDHFQEILQTPLQPSKDILVWSQDSRHIAVHIDCQGFQLDIISAYAPQKGRDAQDIDAWWQDMQNVLQQRTWRAPLLFCGDLNCRIGSVESEGIQSCGADLEDQGGVLFRELCTTQKLVVPATFSELQQGPTHTYIGTRGQRTRNDYIAVSEACLPGVTKAWVDDAIDLLNGDRDHLVVALDMEVAVNLCKHAGAQKAAGYDRQAAREAKKDPANKDIITPLVPWNCDVNEHWDRVRDTYRRYAAQHFPKPKRNKRQHYLSEQAWAILCQKKDVRIEYQEIKRQKRHSLLKHVFGAWKNNAYTTTPFDQLQQSTLMQREACLYEQQLRLTHAFRAQKKVDWQAWVNAQISATIQKANDSKGAALFRALQPKRMIDKYAGRLRKPLPKLVDAQGQSQVQRQHIAIAWQKQFASTENADCAKMSELRSQSVAISNPRPAQFLLELPTLYDLEKAVRSMSDAKAVGVDAIGAELLQTNLVPNVQRLYAMLLKMGVRGQAITEMCGGWMAPLFKGKGSSSLMSGFRGILLEPVVARAISRAWRSKLEKGMQAQAAPMQWGGRKGLSIEAVHLVLKMWQSNSHHKRTALSLVFVDLRSAFYTIVKPLLAHAPNAAPPIRAIFQRLGLPETAFQEFASNIMHANLIKEATRSTAAEQMVAATLQHTWFLVEGGDSLMAPQTGSRPGDPLADLMFGFVAAKVLQQVHAHMHENMPPQDDFEQALPKSVTWVDDMAFKVETDAASLSQETAKVCATIIQVCTEHGLSLSLGANKTAVLMDFKGAGVTKSRQEFELACPLFLPVITEHDGVVNIPVVQHYKHLGGYVTRGGGVLQEVGVRSAQATAKLKPLRHITTDERIGIDQRRTLVRTMALPVLTLHTGTWFDMNNGEYQKWQAAVHKLYRSLFSRDPEGNVCHVSMHDAAAKMQAPMAMELLHIQKLRLLFHVIQEGDLHIQASIIQNFRIAGNGSWLASAVRSLVWMQDQIGVEKIPACAWNLDEFEAWGDAKMHVDSLRKLMYQAREAHLWRVRVHCEVVDNHKQQSTLLHELGWNCPQEFPMGPDNPTVACNTCGKHFATHAAVAVHEAKAHQSRIAVRRWAADGVCRICHKMFHSRVRLMQHWHYNRTKCWFQIMRRYVPMTQADTAALDERDKATGMAFHQKGLREKSQDLAWRPAQEHELQDVLGSTGNICIGQPSQAELDAWSEFGLLPTGQGGRDRTKRKELDIKINNVQEDTQELERALRRDAAAWQAPEVQVARPLSNGTLYVLILFSGHRRMHDIAYYLAARPDVQPITIDLAISEKWGNIMNAGLWLDLARAGRVLAAQAGPPCETFTEARWLPAPDGSVFPRPLRNGDYPFGMLQRQLKEVRQGAVGSILFVRTITILLLVYFHGGAVLLEHPKGDQVSDERWNIWKSSFVNRLLQCPDFRKTTFLQGPLGQPFSKPTTFLTARLPLLADQIFRSYKPFWRPSITLGGKTEDGKQWRTSAAKAYPAALCKIIADQFLWYREQVHTAGESEVPTDLREALDELSCWDPYLLGIADTMKSDFDMKATRTALGGA